MLSYHNKTTVQPKIFSIWNASACFYAALVAAQGQPIGLYFRGVCAILGDGENPKFTAEIARIKGEQRQNRPLSIILPADKITPLIEPAAIAPTLRPAFLDHSQLTARLGSLAFLRLPVRQTIASQLPATLMSRSEGVPMVQCWDSNGHEAINNLISQIQSVGIKYPAGSSMNFSSYPEIVDQNEAIAFAKAANLALFLTDQRDPALLKGSYSILSVGKYGVKLERDGNIAGNVFERLLETKIDRSAAKKAKYPQLTLPPTLTTSLKSHQLRQAILLHLQGWSETKIQAFLASEQIQALAG